MWLCITHEQDDRLRIAQMYALKHARMGGNPEAIADVKNEVDVMKAVRGHPHVLTLRAVVMQGPPGGEVRVSLCAHVMPLVTQWVHVSYSSLCGCA